MGIMKNEKRGQDLLMKILAILHLLLSVAAKMSGLVRIRFSLALIGSLIMIF